MGSSASLWIGVAMSVGGSLFSLGACTTSNGESTGQIGERSTVNTGPADAAFYANMNGREAGAHVFSGDGGAPAQCQAPDGVPLVNGHCPYGTSQGYQSCPQEDPPCCYPTCGGPPDLISYCSGGCIANYGNEGCGCFSTCFNDPYDPCCTVISSSWQPINIVCGTSTCSDDAGTGPTPVYPSPVDVATTVGATTSSPVYAVQDDPDWLAQALAIVSNSSPGVSSAGVNVPNVVDITSLPCFSARNAAAFAPAIAKRLFDNIKIQKPALTIAPTTNPVRIRMAFSQRSTGTGLDLGYDYRAMCLTGMGTFLDLLNSAFQALLVQSTTMNANGADLWMRRNRDILTNGNSPELFIDVDWTEWGISAPANGDWNHSKIVNNGVAALVGGSNLYEEYRPPEAAPVWDRDFVVWGNAAAAARAWNNTIWQDFAGRNGVGVYYHVVVSNNANGPRLVLVTRPTQITDAQHPNAGYPFVVPFPSVAIANPAPAGQGAATSQLTYSGGVKAVDFPDPLVAINAYDQATANMLTAAITTSPVVVRISQQDFQNSTTGVNHPENTQSYIPTGTGACARANLSSSLLSSQCATIQRAALIDLLAQAVSNLPPRTVPTQVKLLKSEGVGYSLHATTAQQIAGLKERVLNQSLVRNNPGGNAANKNRVKGLRGAQFDAIVTAKGTGAQRLHTKFVAIDLGPVFAASVGSLNLYNARMMHDYGNIIVGSPTDAPQVAVRAQFDAQFADAPNTIVADARVPVSCDPGAAAGPVVADLTDPGTAFAFQVDLSTGLSWDNVDVTAAPSFQIEQFGREEIAEVAVHVDCSGNVVLSEQDGADSWNYDQTSMTDNSASMPHPSSINSCSITLGVQGGVATASLTCDGSTISVPLRSLSAASAFAITPELASGQITYTGGDCSNVGATETPIDNPPPGGPGSLPVINGFTPAQGATGAVVDIVGAGFANGTSSVAFGGYTATYTVMDDTHVQASVPQGFLAPDYIYVTTTDGTAQSATPFTLSSGCTAGAAQCADDVSATTCGPDGHWQPAVACPSTTCMNGSCTPVPAEADAGASSDGSDHSSDGPSSSCAAARRPGGGAGGVGIVALVVMAAMLRRRGGARGGKRTFAGIALAIGALSANANAQSQSNFTPTSSAGAPQSQSAPSSTSMSSPSSVSGSGGVSMSCVGCPPPPVVITGPPPPTGLPVTQPVNLVPTSPFPIGPPMPVPIGVQPKFVSDPVSPCDSDPPITGNPTKSPGFQYYGGCGTVTPISIPNPINLLPQVPPGGFPPMMMMAAAGAAAPGAPPAAVPPAGGAAPPILIPMDCAGATDYKSTSCEGTTKVTRLFHSCFTHPFCRWHDECERKVDMDYPGLTCDEDAAARAAGYKKCDDDAATALGGSWFDPILYERVAMYLACQQQPAALGCDFTDYDGTIVYDAGVVESPNDPMCSPGARTYSCPSGGCASQADCAPEGGVRSGGGWFCENDENHPAPGLGCCRPPAASAL